MSRIILQPTGNDTKNDFIKNQYISWAEDEKYKKIWENSVNDTVIFIKNNIIFAIATIEDIKEDYETNKKYPLRFFWNNNIQYVNIPLSDFNNIVGYSSNFIPRNYMVVKDENIHDVFNFLDNFKSQTNDDTQLLDDLQEIDDSKELSKTEKKNLVNCRIGQGSFRKDLIEYWNGCSVTQYQNTNTLIASHIKPWKNSTNNERLDVYNGFLLTPNLDKLFDKGYISFDDKGKIMISNALNNFEQLCVDKSMKIEIKNEHKKYLKFHRDSVFQEV